jgi:hypothetical protein
MRGTTAFAIAAVIGFIWMSSAAAGEPPAGSYLAKCERDWKSSAKPSEEYPCTLELGFDPSLHFRTERDDEPYLLDHYGLVEASFFPGAYDQEPNWSFSIQLGCPAVDATASKCDWKDWRPILRAVTWKPREQLPSDWKYSPVRSREEARQKLAKEALWREADLKTCPGGVQKLLDLENVSWMLFDDSDRQHIQGEPVTELVVPSGHSSYFFVRAGGLTDTTASQDEGYERGPGAWAKEMLQLVEPCLRMLSLPPPWDR